MKQDYSNREIDRMFKEITDTLARIEAQTTKHNGRMTRIEKIMLIVASVVGVLLIVNGSSLINFAQVLIK